MSSEPNDWERLRQLMTAAKQGDRSAYRNFLRGIASQLEGFVNYKAGFLNRTADIVQETLIAIDRAKHTYDENRELKPWALAIARNKITDEIRRTKRHDQHLVNDDIALENAAAAVEEIGDDRSEYVRNAINSLSKSYREVLQLTKLEELSVKETAARLGISESAVKARSSRGYRMLRAKLERQVYEI